MGNQPSSPTPPSMSGKTTPPPPPVEICDVECLKQKELSTLKASLDSIDQYNEPEKYEQARIAYYTALNGQGWLAKEKERIAKDEIEPSLAEYSGKYKELKGEIKTQKVFTNLATALKAQVAGDEEDNNFLQKQLNKEKDRTQTLLRMNEIGASYSTTSWLPFIFDAIYVILGLAIAYLLFTKIPRIMTMFQETVSSVSENIEPE
jgi:hypothetical protein